MSLFSVEMFRVEFFSDASLIPQIVYLNIYLFSNYRISCVLTEVRVILKWLLNSAEYQ